MSGILASEELIPALSLLSPSVALAQAEKAGAAIAGFLGILFAFSLACSSLTLNLSAIFGEGVKIPSCGDGKQVLS